MKKIMIILLVLICVNQVFAGSIYGADYEDKDCTDKHHCIYYDRIINDPKVTVDADTIKGQDIVNNFNILQNDINSNRQSWSETGGGIGLSSFGKYMTGNSEYFYMHNTFEDYLDNYMKKSICYKKMLELEDRDAKLLKYIDELEKRVATLERRD